jgi:hypothetical protein
VPYLLNADLQMQVYEYLSIYYGLSQPKTDVFPKSGQRYCDGEVVGCGKEK